MNKYKIIYNTKWGYCLAPRFFNSKASAIKDAKETQMAFRLFDGEKLIKRGWF